MTLTELAERLPQRFRLLTGARGGAARHRSLEALVAWSFDQLTPSEQRFFARLSVFLGDFDLAAAHAVAGDDDTDELECLALLDALVDKSLVVRSERSGRSRYSLLETLRQFGEARLGRRRARAPRASCPLLHDAARRAETPEPDNRCAAPSSSSSRPSSRTSAPRSSLSAAGGRRTCASGSWASWPPTRSCIRPSRWPSGRTRPSPSAPGLVSPQTVRAHLAASMVLTYMADWQGAERHARAALAARRATRRLHEGVGALRPGPAGLLPGSNGRGRMPSAGRRPRTRRRNGRPVIIATTDHIRLAVLALHRRADQRRTNWRHCGQRAAAARCPRRARLHHGVLRGSGADAGRTRSRAGPSRGGCGRRRHRCPPARLPRLAATSRWPKRPGDPRSSLRALRVALVEHRVARIPFGPRQFAAELLHFFAPLHRWSTIAVLDGAAPPVSIFPDAARQAKEAARRELGDAAFEAGRGARPADAPRRVRVLPPRRARPAGRRPVHVDPAGLTDPHGDAMAPGGCLERLHSSGSRGAVGDRGNGRIGQSDRAIPDGGTGRTRSPSGGHTLPGLRCRICRSISTA